MLTIPSCADDSAERAVARLRLEYKASEAQQQQFQDEVATLQNTLSKTSADLNAKRSEVAQLVCSGNDSRACLTMIKQKATVFDKMQRAEQVQAQVDAAEERLAQVQKV